jgi:GNAT superfamily N-acetyltransferase
VRHANYNGVLGAGCDVDAMLERVRSWGLPARWLVSTGVAELPEPDLHGITVETVEGDSQRDEWHDVLRDGFGLDDNDAPHVAAAHDWPCRHERDRTYLLLRRGRVAVATALLHSPYGVAGVYGIAVRRAFRRQGLGTLATLVTVRAGAERGATVAMLQATKDGFPVYEQLGFRTICAFRSWQIPT